VLTSLNAVIYYFFAVFYRSSARELKVSVALTMMHLLVLTIICSQRLDAILRSSVYSHFSESLSGLATIRAYGEVDRFEKDNIDRVNVENRYVQTHAEVWQLLTQCSVQCILANSHKPGMSLCDTYIGKSY
jgi:ABC-type multidrug transport system fused ATPase/permease subunit